MPECLFQVLGMGADILDGLLLGVQCLKKPGVQAAFRQLAFKSKDRKAGAQVLASELASLLRSTRKHLPWTGTVELGHLTKEGLRLVAAHLKLPSSGKSTELLSRIGAHLTAAGASPAGEYAGHRPFDYLAQAKARAGRTGKLRKVGLVAWDVPASEAKAADPGRTAGPDTSELPHKVVVGTLHAGGNSGNVYHLPGPDGSHPTLCGRLYRTRPECIKVVDTRRDTLVQRFALGMCQHCLRSQGVAVRRAGRKPKPRPEGRKSTTQEDRKKIMALSVKGLTPSQCARELGWSARTVRRVLQELREQGESALRPKLRVRPTPRLLTADHCRDLDLVSRSPLPCGSRALVASGCRRRRPSRTGSSPPDSMKNMALRSP